MKNYPTLYEQLKAENKILVDEALIKYPFTGKRLLDFLNEEHFQINIPLGLALDLTLYCNKGYTSDFGVILSLFNNDEK